MPRVDTDSYNDYQRVYQLARYHRRKQEAISFLGGKCAQCESAEHLEIDHIDPALKLHPVSRFWSIREDLFWAEVRKCQLLCKPHHLEKTRREKSVDHGGGVSGKKNCKCQPCKDRKAAYMSTYKRPAQLVQEPVAQR